MTTLNISSPTQAGPYRIGDGTADPLGTLYFVPMPKGALPWLVATVPGLVAKPIIDIIVAVANSGDESTYVPELEAAGYQLRIREPEWEEHRLLKGSNPDVNLQVFTIGSSEISRMLTLRDWLRENDADRELYAATKRELASRTWKYVQHDADAKTTVIAEIMARAEAARGHRG